LRTYHVVYLLGNLGIGKRGEERESLEEPGEREKVVSFRFSEMDKAC
jgi:hypothetical protein